MNEETFKKAVYIVIALLILLFFTKDIPFFQDQFYHNIKIISNPEEQTVLVNKNNQLEPVFVPKNLEKISLDYAFDEKYVTKETKKAFESLSKDAANLGYQIIAVSAYRDYDYQAKLYQHYLEEKGKEYADACSARPGHSEHQTGLAIDVMGSNQDYNLFLNSKEYNWMVHNAHHYGFILRYPKGKEKITGFKFEPWHYRYVGKDLAQIIYENKWTLEEYWNER